MGYANQDTVFAHLCGNATLVKICLKGRFDNDTEMNTDDCANEIEPLFFNCSLLMKKESGKTKKLTLES